MIEMLCGSRLSPPTEGRNQHMLAPFFIESTQSDGTLLIVERSNPWRDSLTAPSKTTPKAQSLDPVEDRSTILNIIPENQPAVALVDTSILDDQTSTLLRQFKMDRPHGSVSAVCRQLQEAGGGQGCRCRHCSADRVHHTRAFQHIGRTPGAARVSLCSTDEARQEGQTGVKPSRSIMLPLAARLVGACRPYCAFPAGQRANDSELGGESHEDC
jgi:hypothetical protein